MKALLVYDFLSYDGLIVDCKNNTLIDKIINKQSGAKPSVEILHVSIYEGENEKGTLQKIMENHPNLTTTPIGTTTQRNQKCLTELKQGEILLYLPKYDSCRSRILI